MGISHGDVAVVSNVPSPISPFIGRRDAVDTVVRLVEGNRLVTLVGTGGAGKTRLAQEVAPGVAHASPDGVWWVDLLDLGDPQLVPARISQAAMLPEDATDPEAGLARRLSSKSAMFVLDNCEHLVDGVADTVAALLAACPGVKILTTSRSTLNVPGEVAWRIPPMEPDDAAQLFADRANKVRSDRNVTPDTAGVTEICALLDGVPLAIELAAARTRVLTPAEIRDGLVDAGALLSSSQRAVEPRHRGIDASIAWSYELLSDDDQRVLRHLAVFASPFTVEAASALLADAAATAVTALERLVDQSLVQPVHATNAARFRLLETIRQFARKELVVSGEADSVSARHAEYFAGRGRRLWPLFEPNMVELLDDAEDEHADLVAMLEYLEAHANPDEHAQVAMACLPAMSVRRAAEAARLGERAASRVGDRSVLGGHLHLQLALVDPRTQAVHVGVALDAADASGDPLLRAMADYWASSIAVGDPTPDAIAAYEQSRAGLDAVGEGHFSRTYWVMVAAARAAGRHDDALRVWDLARARTVCKRCNVMVWSERARLALASGDPAAARHALATARRFAHEVRDEGFLAQTRLIETEVAAYHGEPWPAAAIEEDLRAAASPPSPLTIGYLFEARGLGLFIDGDWTGADADLAVAVDRAEVFSPRSESRLRQVAIRQAVGDLAGARHRLADMRARAARWDAGPWLLSQVDHRAGTIALDAGEVSDADDLAHRALSDAWLGPFPPLVVDALELLCSVAVARESYAEAARLHGAAQAQREAIGYRRVTEPDKSRRDRDVGGLRAALGDDAFHDAVDQGRRLSLDEAVSYARRARGERKRPSHGWDGLTPTERQVAELAAQGLTNAQIAERLFVGRETVKTHLSNVYAKVGVANRTQLVADATRRGIT